MQPLLRVTPGDAARTVQAHDLVVTDLAAERAAAIEREAQQRGFSAGEREGRDASRERVDAMVARLSHTIETVASLRTDLLRRSETDLVRLAIAIAERIVHREIQIDRDLIMVVARAAIARLGDAAAVTIRINPDDLAAMSSCQEIQTATGPIRLVADDGVAPGGCVVESDLGAVDAALQAQVAEIEAALLGAGR